MSVLPLSLIQKLKPPVNLPVPTRDVATYGSNTVKFHGPVPLHVQLCGLTTLHPFYIVDDSKAGLAPAIGGYDLMKTVRMVLDIDNQLRWSRLTHQHRFRTLMSDPSFALPNCRREMLNPLPFRVNPMQSTRILHPSPQSDPVC